jgi:hypothetical protein
LHEGYSCESVIYDDVPNREARTPRRKAAVSIAVAVGCSWVLYGSLRKDATVAHTLSLLPLFDDNAANMRPLVTRSLQPAWFLLVTAFHVQGYFIAPSCTKDYGPMKRDLTDYIEAAVAEANSIAELGRDNIRLPRDKEDYYKAEYFPQAGDDDLQKGQSKYAFKLLFVMAD